MKNLFTKDGLISVVIAIFFGIFGCAAVFGFDVTSLIAGMGGTATGAILGMYFKESKRGLSEVRPDKWYIPYIVGLILVELLTIYFWTLL